MKKIFSLVIIPVMLVFIACGNNNAATDDRTLNHFIQAFEADFDFNERGVPFYFMIGASNGVIWHGVAGFHPVSIYEFEDIAALEQAFESFPMMEQQGWVTNGRFVIETNIQEIRDFFETIE